MLSAIAMPLCEVPTAFLVVLREVGLPILVYIDAVAPFAKKAAPDILTLSYIGNAESPNETLNTRASTANGYVDCDKYPQRPCSGANNDA
jgi:hypothetical protein